MWPQSIERCLAACYLRPDPREGECVLSVELMQGRRMTLSNVNGVRRINAQVVFQLARQDLDEGAAFVDQGSSGVRIWTMGWFPLVPKDVGGAKLTGELKLRFHLKRAHLLEGLDEACRQELIAHPAAYIRVLNRHTSYEPAAW